MADQKKPQTPIAPKSDAKESTEKPATEQPKPASGFVSRGDNKEDEPKKNRLSFNLTDDGKIDAGSLKGANRQRVKEFLANSKNFAALGIAAPSDEIQAEFTEADARTAIGFLNGLNAGATAFVLKRFKGFEISPQVLERSFQIPPEAEKELTQRGAKLLNRYSTGWMREHADLIFFCTTYIDVVKTQVVTAIMLQAQLNNQPTGMPVKQAVNGQAVTGQPGPGAAWSGQADQSK
jgi:hypothetical protein